VPSARQSITRSPPSSRQHSYPVGKQFPDELLANVPSGSCKEIGRGTRRTEERDERMKKEGVVKIKDECLRNNRTRESI